MVLSALFCSLRNFNTSSMIIHSQVEQVRKIYHIKEWQLLVSLLTGYGLGDFYPFFHFYGSHVF